MQPVDAVSPERRRRKIASAHVAGSPVELAVVGFIIVVALYFGQAILVPLALAVILAFILALPVRALRRVGVPNAPAVLLVVIFAFSVIFGVGALITQQVGSLAEQIPRYQLTLKDKVKALKSFAAGGGGGAIERAGETLKDLQDELDTPERSGGVRSQVITADDEGAQRPVPVEVRTPEPSPLDRLQTIIGIILAPLATTGIVILFVLFLLLQRVDVRDRAIRLLGSNDLERSTTAMDDAGHRLSSYFLALTAVNAAYGIFIGCALWALGVPTPILWGVLAMLMRFVPFIGSFIAAAFPLLLAAAVDQSWTMFFATLGLYVAGELIMGNLIEPVVQGNRTGMSPLAIILSAAFWTLLWGPIGLLMAIPLTVVLVVLGRHVERLEFLHVLLGDAPPLAPAERFYQRMLAGDPAEAIEQAEAMIKNTGLADYYDDVLMEGLSLANADIERGMLEPERLVDVHESADVVIDTLADAELAPPRAARKDAEADKETAQNGEAARDGAEAEDEEAGDLQIPSSVAAEWQNETAIVCIGSRTPLDHTAAAALEQLLSKCGLGASVVGPGEVKHGALRSLDLSRARLICISALDVRDRSAHTRFLVRRLRRAAPDAVLLGGFWKLDPENERDRAVMDSIAVDASAVTVKDAVRYCLEAAAAEPGRDGAPLTEVMPAATAT
jgi:predicted PurR-regulated permease PerM